MRTHTRLAAHPKLLGILATLLLLAVGSMAELSRQRSQDTADLADRERVKEAESLRDYVVQGPPPPGMSAEEFWRPACARDIDCAPARTSAVTALKH